ncbi:MAG: gamma carbonic anhydrase family protein [Cellulosilyticaceae bacterium]
MIEKFREYSPKIDETVFVAPNATVIGQVSIGESASIWHGAIIRGDEATITIGPKTNVQDGVVIHIGHDRPTVIGEGVTIGHRAIVHGAEVGDYTLIGMGSTILDGAQIGKNCIIGANSLVTSHTRIDDGMMAVGTPAKVIRPLTHEEIQKLYDSANSYVSLAKEYKK